MRRHSPKLPKAIICSAPVLIVGCMASKVMGDEHIGKQAGTAKDSVVANVASIDVAKRWKYSIPENAVSRCGLPEGILFKLLRQGKSAEVRILLNQTPKKVGDEIERKMWLASCFSSEQRYEQAITLFNQVPDLEDAPNMVAYLAAVAYADADNQDKSIQLTSAILKHWAMPDALRLRAGCYVLKGKFELAVKDYLTLSQLDTKAKRRYLVRAGNLLVKMGKPERALALMDEASLVEEKNGSPDIWLVRGDCYKSLAQWAKAKDCFSKALEIIGRQNYASRTQGAMLSVCYKERALCYDKLRKIQLAEADRKMLRSISKSVEDDLIGK